MKHGTLLGGKRARPFLTYVTGQMLGADCANLDTPAAAVECIHAYSLIHDDLPAMDDDNLRRGQPTCHIAFDEATAILAGDSLQTLAFEILASGTLSESGEKYRIQMIKELAQASGAAGMCMGQALDLAAEGQEATLQQLETIHKHKTGALIRCAIRLGALAAGDKGAEILPPAQPVCRCYRGWLSRFRTIFWTLPVIRKPWGKPQGSDLELEKKHLPGPARIGRCETKSSATLSRSATSIGRNTLQYRPIRSFCPIRHRAQ